MGITGKTGTDGTHLHFDIRAIFRDNQGNEVANPSYKNTGEIDPMGWWGNFTPTNSMDSIDTTDDPWAYWKHNEDNGGHRGAPSFWAWESSELVDDLDVSFWRFNHQNLKWHDIYEEGYSRENHAFYTYADYNPSRHWNNFAIWGLKPYKEGYYDIKAYIPQKTVYKSSNPQIETDVTTQAEYYVYYTTPLGVKRKTKVILNQQNSRGDWASLGTYQLASGVGENAPKVMVQITDEVGSSSEDSNENVIFADAMKLVKGGCEPAGGFPDIEETAWYKKFVSHSAGRCIVKGYPDGNFRPSDMVNRAEGIKMLSEALRLTPEPCNEMESVYADVSNSAWYCPYVKAAKTRGVLGDFINANNEFHPGSSMTRKDVMLMLSRLKEVPIEDNNKTNCYTTKDKGVNRNLYEDLAELSNKEKNAIIWPSHAEINISSIKSQKGFSVVEGRNKNENNKRFFVPTENVNRAEMAKIVVNASDFFDSNPRNIESCVRGGGMAQSMDAHFTPQTITDTSITLGSFYEQIIDPTNANAPTVDLGGDRVVAEGETISFSLPQTDLDGDKIHYAWFASDGYFYALENTYYRNIEWTAPQVDETRTITMRIIAQDGRGKVAYDDLTITVQKIENNFDYVSVRSGRWSQPSTWNTGTVPTVNSRVKVTHGVELNGGNSDLDYLEITDTGYLYHTESIQTLKANTIVNRGKIIRDAAAKRFELSFDEAIYNYGIISEDASQIFGLAVQGKPKSTNFKTMSWGEIETQAMHRLQIETSGTIYNEGIWAPFVTKIMNSTRLLNSMTINGAINSFNTNLTVNYPHTLVIKDILSSNTWIEGTGTVKTMGNVINASIEVPNIIFHAEEGEVNVLAGVNRILTGTGDNIYFTGQGTKKLQFEEFSFIGINVIAQEGITEIDRENFLVDYKLNIKNGAILQNASGINVNMNVSGPGSELNQEEGGIIQDNPEGGSITYPTSRFNVDLKNGITLADALLTLRKALALNMLGTDWKNKVITGDVNCDDEHNTVDAMLILRKSKGLSLDGTSWCGE